MMATTMTVRRSHLTSSWFLLFSTFINRYKFVCIHDYNTGTRYTYTHTHDDTLHRWIKATAKMNQSTHSCIRSTLAHSFDASMTKVVGDDEARVSFIYHFNIYLSSLSSSPSSSLRTERTERRTQHRIINTKSKKKKKTQKKSHWINSEKKETIWCACVCVFPMRPTCTLYVLHWRSFFCSFFF